MLIVERRGPVAVLSLDRGVTNPLNPSLVGRLSAELAGVRSDSAVAGLVLTGRNDKFFSIGWDIPELFELGRDEFAAFLRAFDAVCLHLFTFPKPTVAAITGHAVAGGCILALCCDYRFIADGRKLMGLNEIKLGVPIPWVADCVLRRLVGFRTARDIVDAGSFYEPTRLAAMGLVDAVLPLPDVVDTAARKASELGQSPGDAFAAIKGDRVQTAKAEILASLEAKEKTFVDRWYSEAARQRLREAIEKF